MKTLVDLQVKIFADGAEKSGMLEMYRNRLIKGFTTNPTLMRQAGIAHYEAFARDILRVRRGRGGRRRDVVGHASSSRSAASASSFFSSTSSS